jgi:hypothetical protein
MFTVLEGFNMNIGDIVKVKNQNITGIIVEQYGNKVVIEDDSSEYEAPDNRLEYFVSELEEEKTATQKFLEEHFQLIKIGF